MLGELRVSTRMEKCGPCAVLQHTDFDQHQLLDPGCALGVFLLNLRKRGAVEANDPIQSRSPVMVFWSRVSHAIDRRQTLQIPRTSRGKTGKGEVFAITLPEQGRPLAVINSDMVSEACFYPYRSREGRWPLRKKHQMLAGRFLSLPEQGRPLAIYRSSNPVPNSFYPYRSREGRWPYPCISY